MSEPIKVWRWADAPEAVTRHLRHTTSEPSWVAVIPRDFPDDADIPWLDSPGYSMCRLCATELPCGGIAVAGAGPKKGVGGG